MREIKFRAWFTEGYPSEYVKKSYLYHDNLSIDGCLDGVDHGNVVLEQYTGLKDKNGKEIYEGDIIECVDPGDIDFPKWIDRVEWDKNGYWTVDGGNVLGNIYGQSQVKIIGNIHETPELLNK